MKYTIKAIAGCLAAVLLLSGCSLRPGEAEIKDEGLLHVTGTDHAVGDVHPFYNPSEKTWYLFYLMYHNGAHEPRLMTSDDMLTWMPRKMAFTGGAPMQTYYVLGVIPFEDRFYSYFGNGYTMQSSKSKDLFTWEYSRGTNIPNSQVLYPGGARDPYVFYDADSKVYRCISTAYRTHDGMGIGRGMDVSIALSGTKTRDLTSWQWNQQDLIRFLDGKKGEPECTQAFKIGDRWYITAAMLNRTNTVGKLSYWTGDAGKGITEVSWQEKAERGLDGENLCAPQLAEKDGRMYMWGWIPSKAFGGSWGGHISLGREVYALSDGTLAVRLAEAIAQQIRGRLLEQKEAVSLTPSASYSLSNQYDRVDLELKTTGLSDRLVIDIGGTSVVVDRKNQRLECRQGGADGKAYASAVFNQPIGDVNTIQIIAEADIIEIFVNNHTSLCARIADPINQSKIKMYSARESQIAVRAYQLRCLEEITQR